MNARQLNVEQEQHRRRLTLEARNPSCEPWRDAMSPSILISPCRFCADQIIRISETLDERQEAERFLKKLDDQQLGWVGSALERKLDSLYKVHASQRRQIIAHICSGKCKATVTYPVGHPDYKALEAPIPENSKLPIFLRSTQGGWRSEQDRIQTVRRWLKLQKRDDLPVMEAEQSIPVSPKGYDSFPDPDIGGTQCLSQPNTMASVDGGMFPMDIPEQLVLRDTQCSLPPQEFDPHDFSINEASDLATLEETIKFFDSMLSQQEISDVIDALGVGECGADAIMAEVSDTSGLNQPYNDLWSLN